MINETVKNVGSADAGRQAVTDEIFRLISIEPNNSNATTAGGKRLPRTRLVLQNGQYASLQGVDWNKVLDFKSGDVVKVTGSLKEYKGQPQLSLQSIDRVGNLDAAQAARLLPTYPGDVKVLEARLDACIKDIPDARLSRLAAVLLDPATDLGKRFRLAPASPAGISHEPYIHGLLQHLTEVAETARALALKAKEFRPAEYSNVNLGFVMFGALIHDLAKTSAYEYGAEGIKFSVAGRLNGHLIESYALVRNALHGTGEFKQEEIDQILHIIASHHGPDSDQAPRTLEATIVHHADYFCSQLGSRFGFPHTPSNS